jgi:hypothetical protein
MHDFARRKYGVAIGKNCDWAESVKIIVASSANTASTPAAGTIIQHSARLLEHTNDFGKRSRAVRALAHKRPDRFRTPA